MTVKIKNQKIEKINFEVLPRPTAKKQDGPVNVTITMNIKIDNVLKIDQTTAKILAVFSCKIENFGNITVNSRVTCAMEDVDKFILAIKNKNEKDLPPNTMPSIINAVFYFIMPLVMLMAEKGGIPIPLPPIITDTFQKNMKSQKSTQTKVKKK